MISTIEQQAAVVIDRINSTPQLKQFVNNSLPIPKVYRGVGNIRLIILGQDPTVKNRKSLRKITTVLNLNKSGNIQNYLNTICKGLGLELEKNVYATNFLKNFFVKPPTQFKDYDIFKIFANVWLPLLQKELDSFYNIPMITLGQPVLSLIILGDAPKLVREYWGYTSDWKSGRTLSFQYLLPSDNILNRKIFPFPHQPSITKQFYRSRLMSYVEFMRDCISSQ